MSARSRDGAGNNGRRDGGRQGSARTTPLARMDGAPLVRPHGVRLQQKSGFPSERAFYIGRPHNAKLRKGSNAKCRKCQWKRSIASLGDVAYGSPVSNCDSPPSSTSLNGCACARSALPEIAQPIHREGAANMQLCFPLRHFRCRRSLCTPLRRTGSRSFPD